MSADRPNTPLRAGRASVDWYAVVILGIALFLLLEPALLWARFSTAEVALASLAGLLGLALLRGATPLRAVGIPIPLVGLLAAMTLSIFVSSDRWTSLQDVVAYAFLCVAAIVAVTYFTFETIIIGVALAAFAGFLLSVVALGVSPETAVYGAGGAVQGIYGNRNAFGYVMVQGLPAALLMTLPIRSGRFVKWTVVACLLVGVVASNSKTAWIAAAVTLCAMGGMLLVRRSRRYLYLIVTVVLVGAAFALLRFDLVLAALGKDSSGNGRTEIWSAVVGLIPESPVLGFGWAESWAETSVHSLRVAESVGGRAYYHAHNEVLNWLVTTGVLGLVFWAALYVLIVGVGVAGFIRTGALAAAWIPVSALMLLTRGVSEISETAPQGWLLLMLLAASSGATPGPIRRWVVVDFRSPPRVAQSLASA